MKAWPEEAIVQQLVAQISRFDHCVPLDNGARMQSRRTLDVQCKRGYSKWVIRTFSCKKTERLFNREAVKEFANIAVAARRRLFALNNARILTDLRIPPGNRLEALATSRRKIPELKSLFS